MRVDTLLRKEKDGTLYREHKTASSATGFTSSGAFANDSLGGPGPQIGRPATAKRKEYDSPTRDDEAVGPKTESTQTNRGTTALSPALDKMGGVGRLVRRDELPTDEEESLKNQDRSGYSNVIMHHSTDPARRDPVAIPKNNVTGDI